MSLIPQSFELAGIPIVIQIDNNFAKEKGCLGQSIYQDQKIILDGLATPIETTEASAMHEIVHWIFFIMNRHDLRNDESFVDAFSYLLHQFIKSSGYELPDVKKIVIQTGDYEIKQQD